MKLTPRFSKEVEAIKLTSDLIGEPGDYLIISDGQPHIVNAESAKMLFLTTTAKPRAVTPNKKLTKFQAACLAALGPDSQGNFPAGLSPQRVAEISNISRTTVYGALDALAQRGFISSKLSPEKQKLFTITPSGVKAWRSSSPQKGA